MAVLVFVFRYLAMLVHYDLEELGARRGCVRYGVGARLYRSENCFVRCAACRDDGDRRITLADAFDAVSYTHLKLVLKWLRDPTQSFRAR